LALLDQEVAALFVIYLALEVTGLPLKQILWILLVHCRASSVR